MGISKSTGFTTSAGTWFASELEAWRVELCDLVAHHVFGVKEDGGFVTPISDPVKVAALISHPDIVSALNNIKRLEPIGDRPTSAAETGFNPLLPNGPIDAKS